MSYFNPDFSDYSKNGPWYYIGIVTAGTCIFLVAYDLFCSIIFTREERMSMLLNIVFAASFISIFFFTVGSNIEHDIVNIQVDNIVKDLTSGATVVLPANTLNSISQSIAALPPPDLKALDAQVAQSNNVLFTQTWITILIFFVLSIFYMIFRYKVSWPEKNKDVSLRHIIGDNIVLIIFIGLTEFIFLYVIAKQYKSGDPNRVKLTILDSLQNIQPAK